MATEKICSNLARNFQSTVTEFLTTKCLPNWQYGHGRMTTLDLNDHIRNIRNNQNLNWHSDGGFKDECNNISLSMPNSSDLSLTGSCRIPVYEGDWEDDEPYAPKNINLADHLKLEDGYVVTK